ncbi:Mut7-C ubiquitin/RNAse domain-containing protein [Corallococcus sp. AS-1-12]|uniref:Mut7-C ubiquitin/RNAse domain-containing protein n=1 Tax=Corallococcus sp. AS-1-12 TaxID=2874598 RepID=UPI001CBEF729|nr:Mut7-C ubiquitin/RNAse domain-containing protein [Corallococcus sp. AS-1-12]MBZ4335965.1 Mut7-C ubiquitin/RNAse domain-containing protein [Corallococcus sp. AS-1-12]
MSSRQLTVRIHGALNDFVAPERRGQTFTHVLQGSPSVKDLIESLGPPHPEVDVVLVDGEPVGFGDRAEADTRIDVYPASDPSAPRVARVGPPIPDMPRFILDVGLGRLSGFLRMLGLDTLWRNDSPDDTLARVSRDEARVLLTRDLGVLKRSEVVLGYYPRETDPAHQLVEVVRRYGLTSRMRPFSRCIACNAPLSTATPEEVQGRVPEGVTQRHRHFQQCPGCQRVFWPGTHHERMQKLVETLRKLEQSA